MNLDTDYSAEDTLHAECCEAIARKGLDSECIEVARQRDSARAIAARLEAELAAVRALLRFYLSCSRMDFVRFGVQAQVALIDYVRSGSLSWEATRG